MNPSNIRHSFSEAQKSALLQAVAQKVAMSVCRFRSTISPESLAGCANYSVYGAFVSLKYRGKLRACCGWVGESVLLRDALDQAALRSATEDTRFAPIQPSELHELKMEVWILSGPELIAGEGEGRAEYVEVGKHGLVIVHPQGRGLLLPGVAVEMGWTSREFLEGACRKAGLPKDIWKDKGTMVLRYEADCFSGDVFELLPDTFPKEKIELPRAPKQRDLARLASFTLENILKMLRNETPDFYLAGAYDGNVEGICLRMRFQEHYADLSRFSMDKTYPLQATLFNLSQKMYLSIAQARAKNLPSGMELCAFWAPEFLGSADEVDLSNLNTRSRGLLILRLGRWVITYTSRRQARLLLDEALKEYGFARDKDTHVYAIHVVCTESSFLTSSVQRPNEQFTPRSPVAAGSYYPNSPTEMQSQLDKLFSASVPAPQKGRAVIVPHAGWQFSGALVAETLRQIEIPSHAVVFGAKHVPAGVDWAVAPVTRWLLPGISLDGDVEFAQEMVDAVSAFQLDSFAHVREHSIEVMLPILARLAPQTKVIGAVMAGNEAILRRSAKRMAEWLCSRTRWPLLIASTDLNHFASEEHTQKVDALVIDAIEHHDPERLLREVREHNISMCGAIPVAFLLMVLQEANIGERVIRVGHTTSGAVTGNTQDVVGYYGAFFV